MDREIEKEMADNGITRLQAYRKVRAREHILRTLPGRWKYRSMPFGSQS